MSSPKKWFLTLPPIESLIEFTSNSTREAVLGALRQGPVPQHVAFVMDGNRRYARGLGKEVIEGHSAGFENLAKTLEICYKIGVKAVTVYAFSIENFKRTKYEVDALMDMAKTRLVQLAEHGELLQRYGACIKFVGRREDFRPDVLEAIDRAMKLTENNGQAVLNIAAPYTSREEMTRAIRETVQEYCQPIPKRLKRPFSETHITRNLQAQRRESSTVEDLPSSQNAKDMADSNDDITTNSDSISYTPNSPETQLMYQKFSNRLSSILRANGATDIDDSDLQSATNIALFALKHGLYVEDEKQDEYIEVLNTTISGTNLDLLQSLADALSDYPVSPSIVSETTTLNTDPNSAHTSKFRDVEQITEETLTSHTYTADMPPVDILVRTSGVERLSDFLLWQCHEKTDIKFVQCMWPEFSLRHFVPIILEWQWRQKKDDYWKGDWSKIE